MLTNSILICKKIEKCFINGEKIVTVIKPANLQIQKGTCNIITGESGSGKTTLLSMMAGIECPTGGTVYFEDTDLYSLSEKRQAHIRGINFGFVFQSFHLLPELTLEDNIKVPAIINHVNLKSDYYNHLIKILRLKGKTSQYPSELSGGEQQRAAIARAMILQPGILFADEPTGNLDRKNSERIVSLLKSVNEYFKTTIVMVTHDKHLFEKPDSQIHILDGTVSQQQG